VTAASAVLIGLIGPSRVRTGDHRWSDVLGGYALGASFLAALVWAARRDRELRPEPEWRGTGGFEPIAAGRVEVDAMVLLEADDHQVDQLLDQLGVPDLQR
jgi:membrane-associated phospholipid phosphatase